MQSIQLRKRCRLGFFVQRACWMLLSVVILLCCLRQPILVSSFHPATPSAVHRRLSGVSGVQHGGHSLPRKTLLTRMYDKKPGNSNNNNESPLLVDKEEEKAGIPIETLFGRALDTVEDAIRLAGRITIENGWMDPPSTAEMSQCPTLVVLGSGWASHALLKIVDTTKTRLILISPSNHFVFTPSMYACVRACVYLVATNSCINPRMETSTSFFSASVLASSSVGTVELRSMTESVRAANPSVNYIEGSATDVDIANQMVTVELMKFSNDIKETNRKPLQIRYDRLVVAVGCKIADQLVPGASEHCLRLKSCEDSRRLRRAIGESLEHASRPDVADDPALPDAERQRRQAERRKRATFCVIGGGPTGVEFAGELSDFLCYATRDRVGVFENLKNDFRIVVVEGMDKLLPPFDPALRDHACK